VVLLHGLTNKNPWSDAFLEACLDAWGDGRVYLVFTNTSERERLVVSSRRVGNRTVTVGGVDNASAGDRSVAVQSADLAQIVQGLQRSHGLDEHFSVVAHSMGGLVARHYVDAHPGTVTGLVTLGTPHLGSPLATDFRWAGLFMGATDAIADLAPDRCATFNREHPVAKAPLANGGRIFTIQGDADGTDSFGAYGELALGWAILSERHGTDSDGLVPTGNAHIEGGVPLAEFPDLDHFRLVRDPAVARKAASALP
jgi:triacylglycerol lipase